MSTAAKQSIFILIALLVVSLGFGGYTLMEKQKLEEAKASLEGRLEQASARENKNIIQIRNLEEEKNALQGALDEEQGRTASLQAQLQDAQNEMNTLEARLRTEINDLEEEKDSWQQRLDRIRQERDQLLVRLREAREARQEAQAEAPPPPAEPRQARTERPEVFRGAPTPSADQVDEEYWAQILKEKAQLEVEVDRLKEKINEDSMEIVELKQKNQQLELKLDSLESQKAQIEREIRDKEEMVNRLSLELARAKNDRKFEETQVTRLKEENRELRKDMQDLVSAKNSLEKSILRLTQDKAKMEKKLGQTETIIQSKIDEIWEIKDSIDESFKQSKVETKTANEVELPPIIVKNKGDAVNYMPGKEHAGFNGRVVSVNDENNFVIVDIGETQGLRLGDALNVYRDSKYIARLEVIQVRKDIAAADIQDQWSRIRVGDVIR